MNHTNSVEERKLLFLTKAKKAHGDTYDYSKVVYKTAQQKIEILCRKHGSFWQMPDAHTRGVGCRLCGFEKCKPKGYSKKKPPEQFIKECTEIHGGKYDYSKTLYTGKVNKVDIICPEHGLFTQKAETHRQGAGCPACGIKKAHTHFKKDSTFFIEMSKKVHGDLFTYENTQYTGNKNPVVVTCKIHGDFSIKRAGSHYIGDHPLGCPQCSEPGSSKAEREIADFIKENGFEILEGDRSIISPLELDIVIPSKMVAIEFNGLYWHSEEMGKDKKYHLNKLHRANAKGYRLVQIFEDEWVNSKELTKKKVLHLLGVSTSERLFARKLVVEKISKAESDKFFIENHIQGTCSSSLVLGLRNGSELVACMSFGRNRFTKDMDLELLRFATSKTIVGGFSKILAAFFRSNPGVQAITSYSDKRWSEGGVYKTNGFEYVGSSEPGYFYVHASAMKRYNRVLFQKHKLPGKLKVFDPILSETENMKNNGYMRVFDCGMDKWVYKRPENI